MQYFFLASAELAAIFNRHGRLQVECGNGTKRPYDCKDKRECAVRFRTARRVHTYGHALPGELRFSGRRGLLHSTEEDSCLSGEAGTPVFCCPRQAPSVNYGSIMMKLYQERFYRCLAAPEGLDRFQVRIRESDLLVFAERRLDDLAYRALGLVRGEIERYIERRGEFARSLEPCEVAEGAPGIVKAMADSARAWGVGPMASVAGAIAEEVGRALLAESNSVIVENGGDIFLALPRGARLGLYAGEESPFTDRVVFEVPESRSGLGVCTSSGTVGHSLSFGCADAVVAVAERCADADAAATAIANEVKSPADVSGVVDRISREGRLRGLLVAAGDRLGLWGDIRILRQENRDDTEKRNFSFQA
jgi:ApbE superfamily uncharacterized protein (UPF0280 family)